MTKLKKLLSISLCSALVLTQVSFAYATEETQQPQSEATVVQEVETDTPETAGDAADEQASETQAADSSQEEAVADTQAEDSSDEDAEDEAAAMTVSEDDEESADVITPEMTQEEINKAIEAATGKVVVEAGDYKDKNLFVTNKDVVIKAGEGDTSFRFVKVEDGTLIMRNNLKVNEIKEVVGNDKCAFELVNATVEGNNKKLEVTGANSGTQSSAYTMSAKGSKVELNDVELTVSGSNGDRGLLNINSTAFKANNSDIQVCGNSGKNYWGSAGAPNICVGRDAVCETREIMFKNCTVNASGSVHPYGDGFQINKTTDPCTITFDTCNVNFDNNGGNGFMGQTAGGDQTKKVVVINSNVSASKNGGGNGASIGFANAAITLKNTDKEAGGYTFEVSDNYRLGIASNGLGAFTSINAEGYKIVANRNGVNSPDRVFGYGMYLARGGSSFDSCILEAEGNQKDGITFGGDAKVTVNNTEIRTVLNGSNGLVIDAETDFSDSEILSACNGSIKGDDVDTTANKTFTFSNGTKGSIGNVVLNKDGTADDNSKVVASFEGESSAVTAGDTICLIKGGAVDESATEGDLSHHVIDWDNGKVIKEPTDTEYGSLEGDCCVCGHDAEFIPLVRVVYHKNTEDEVTGVPETEVHLSYASDIDVSGTPEREGYTFTGWYIDADTTQKCEGEMKDKEPTINLYAGWEKKEEPVKPEDPTDPTEPQDPTDPVNPTDPTDPTEPTNPVVPRRTPTPAAVTPGVAPAAIVPAAATTAANPANNATPELRNLKDNEVPLASGAKATWALVNFALMNLAVFESIMLLIGYFVKTKNSDEEKEDDEDDGRKLKKRGIVRLISIPVAIVSVVAFILTEDISNPTAFVDKFTIMMALIALIQTGAVALSRKKYVNGEEI